MGFSRDMCKAFHNVKHINLDLSLTPAAWGDAHGIRPRMADFLCAAQDLVTLKLSLDIPSLLYPGTFLGFFGECSWPNFQEIALGGVAMEAHSLQNFILRHKGPLRKLHFHDVKIIETDEDDKRLYGPVYPLYSSCGIFRGVMELELDYLEINHDGSFPNQYSWNSDDPAVIRRYLRSGGDRAFAKIEANLNEEEQQQWLLMMEAEEIGIESDNEHTDDVDVSMSENKVTG